MNHVLGGGPDPRREGEFFFFLGGAFHGAVRSTGNILRKSVGTARIYAAEGL